ncbi:MAG: lamin tail domain-containing protein [Alphaproteobacteria bacterium]|nr:lamin tail domain-containing protein [Alphaproteobacteria bacterium]MCB9690684.1 lamin tail domain-containing protein [Alphaproteobacteria bacterium]
MRAWIAILAVLGACKGEGGAWVPPDLVVNELVASNASGLQDASGAFPDWLEIANLGDEDVELSSYTLTDDSTLPQKWSFPAGTSIPAGGYLVIFADGDPAEPGEVHTTFRLEILGEELAIFGPATEDLPLLDQVVYPEQTTDVAWARMPDGTGEFAADPTPTPGAANE